MVKRGEIWLATLDPTVGSEIQKTRPCLVISPPEIHDHLRTVIVAPMTSKSRPAGFRIPISFQGTDGLVLLEQSRTIDKTRLIKRLGSAPPATLSRVLAVLRELYED
ncbi:MULTISPECIES: type II toxin-antitoxin system PemK/MazF family toxin [Bosea]|jgi:mRNA interferase MazF|uniref:type II toxin-antitoxin system PemK/MazF family toxin n=1 Tax=Bosea TaxID=85413 RepID=UPI00214F7D9B|nr:MULTISPECIES: type II toxin-antitoxin system PemK/MazF family toxin [Bosea]MCR4523880.1 type II toxin-antitoxin system PemK/MazF family toxin [Bosea sp. 47.2.35]MDR6830301.1 mRNA interferase MazF [Bosea robiniae]MDR6897056.1 mRNA interferase MazF [Bosea sp. BE109]MDR7140453.1 mRNA interferase MazF [Bosea sp. BE168]MDR7177226.1 mRNA interferase MazF [Bosea sp. BE271]